MDRAVDPAAAEQGRVRGVDDRVGLRVGRDVAAVQRDHGFSPSGAPGTSRISALVELSWSSSPSPCELGDDPLGEHLAELDAPLVEGVDPPDRALGEDRVLVQRDELAERRRVEPLGADHVRGPVAVELLVRDELLGHALGADLVLGLAEGERLRLGEDVGDELVLVLARAARR